VRKLGNFLVRLLGRFLMKIMEAPSENIRKLPV
jgi:hypothetical protein